jgi:hypothetical protein
VLYRGVKIALAGGRRPKPGDHFMAGERSKGERGNEPLGRFRHHHVDIERLALQGTYKLRRLIRGDPPRNTNRNLHSDDCNPGQTTTRGSLSVRVGGNVRFQNYLANDFRLDHR